MKELMILVKDWLWIIHSESQCYWNTVVFEWLSYLLYK